jgi:hypothetical protein
VCVVVVLPESPPKKPSIGVSGGVDGVEMRRRCWLLLPSLNDAIWRFSEIEGIMVWWQTGQLERRERKVKGGKRTKTDENKTVGRETLATGDVAESVAGSY